MPKHGDKVSPKPSFLKAEQTQFSENPVLSSLPMAGFPDLWCISHSALMSLVPRERQGMWDGCAAGLKVARLGAACPLNKWKNIATQGIFSIARNFSHLISQLR